jgi:DNA-binding CsgD family transcriptional regulator
MAAITVLYALALASFGPPLAVAAYLRWKNSVPLAGRFAAFETAYGLFVLTLAAAYLVLGQSPSLAWETLFNTVFFALYPLLLRFLAPLTFELLQRRWDGPWRALTRAVVWLGPCLALAVHAVVFDGAARAVVLRVTLNAVYFPLFLAAVSAHFVLLTSRARQTTDPWKRRALRRAVLVYWCSLPLFVVDAAWPLVQLQWGWLPRGLNLQLATVLAWNVVFTVSWYRYPASLPPVETGDPDPDLMGLLTDREREIARLIVAGSSNQVICERLGVRLGTTKNHIYNIFNKTGASSRKELAAMLLARA